MDTHLIRVNKLVL